MSAMQRSNVYEKVDQLACHPILANDMEFDDASSLATTIVAATSNNHCDFAVVLSAPPHADDVTRLARQTSTNLSPKSSTEARITSTMRRRSVSAEGGVKSSHRRRTYYGEAKNSPGQSRVSGILRADDPIFEQLCKSNCSATDSPMAHRRQSISGHSTSRAASRAGSRVGSRAGSRAPSPEGSSGSRDGSFLSYRSPGSFWSERGASDRSLMDHMASSSTLMTASRKKMQTWGFFYELDAEFDRWMWWWLVSVCALTSIVILATHDPDGSRTSSNAMLCDHH